MNVKHSLYFGINTVVVEIKINSNSKHFIGNKNG
jgi:hypothetical protein